MKKTYWPMSVAAFLLCSVPALAAEPLPGHPYQFNIVVVADKENGPQPPAPPPDAYWLGLEYYPAPPALRAQLQLPENQGFVVQTVVPDSPAAKSGIVQNDVILKADDKPLLDIHDLPKIVNTVKDKEIKLEIIHNGQPKTVAITPAKRPAGLNPPGPPPGGDLEALQKWLEHMQQGLKGDMQGPMQFRFMRPGVILPPGAPTRPPLPGNMTVAITKTGDKPADITVTMDNEKWQVTEKELDKLPDKVRPYVEHMLGGTMGFAAGGQFVPDVVPPNFPQMPAPFGPGESGPSGPGLNLPPRPNGPIMGPFEKNIEKRLEEMNQRMEELRNDLHNWQRGDKSGDTTHPSDQPVEKSDHPTPENNQQ